MTERGYELWKGIDSMIPDIWNRPASSGGKYHKREDGRVHSIAEHTYEMIYSGIKIFRMLNIKLKTSRGDSILFSIGLHDRLKYGEHGELKHTTGEHDHLIGELLGNNFQTFRKYMSDEEVCIMVEAARFHSGQWSSDVGDKKNFDFRNFYPDTMFVHCLDMLSTTDCLKCPETN